MEEFEIVIPGGGSLSYTENCISYVMPAQATKRQKEMMATVLYLFEMEQKRAAIDMLFGAFPGSKWREMD